MSFLSRSSFEISLSKESNVPPCYLLSSHFFLVDRIPTTLSFFHHFFSRIFKLVRSLQTSIPNVIPSSSNGNIEFNPNYPCFFERIFTNFPFHHFFFLSFSLSLSFPSRATCLLLLLLLLFFPTLSRPLQPSPCSLVCSSNTEKNFRPTALTFSTTIPPPLSIIPLPSNKDPTCHVSPFLAPSDPARSVTGAVPHQLFSRSGAGEVKNGRVDLAVAKSGIGNMVTIRVYMCVCVRAWREKHAALELICPSNHLPRTHLDG